MRWYSVFPTEYIDPITLARSYYRRSAAQRITRDWYYLSNRLVAHAVIDLIHSLDTRQRFISQILYSLSNSFCHSDTTPGELATITEEARITSSLLRLLAAYFPEGPADLIAQFLFRSDFVTF